MSDWKDYGMGNPTDQEKTMTAPITKDAEGNILEQYQDTQNDKQYASAPNTSTPSQNSATGSGLEAALGSDYSWNTKAEERAGLDYEAKVLDTKKTYLTNRQELESQGQQMQEQVAMQKYSQNQSSEKAGWTGGYILDTERQMSYLKETIQSQMYGQMELQKYGYDTSLAAARLAYDTSKYDLALQYYNDALQRAVTEAEITGYYVSPEASEMLNEYSIASSILNDETASEEDKARADKILSSVYKWFEDNGISKQGVETYSHLVEERTHRMSVEKTLNYIDTANKQISTDVFTKVDAQGNAIFNEDGTTVTTVNFSQMSHQDIVDYISGNETATQQYYGFLDTKITAETEAQFEDWLISKGAMTKNDDDSYSTKEGVDYEEYLYSFLQSSQIYKDLVEDLVGAEDINASALYDLYTNWDFQIVLPDGTSITKSFKELDDAKQKAKNVATSGSLQDLTNKNAEGEYTVDFKPTKQNTSLNGNTVETVYIKDSNLIFTSLVGNEGTGMFDSYGGRHGEETDVKLSNGLEDKYNLELAESVNTSSINTTDTQRILEIYERTYGKTMPPGTIIVYNDAMYVYCSGGDIVYDNDATNNGDGGFAKLKGQCNSEGHDDFVTDLKGAMGI